MGRIGKVGLCVLAASMLAAHPLVADDDDHERARAALSEGRILPLAEILKRLSVELPGEVIEVELEQDDDGRFEYEIKVLTTDGRVKEAEIDAADGRIISIEDDD
jgi:uncharacterized membrane protein YkoI